MDEELKNFIDKNRKKKSSFDEYQKEIFMMIDAGVTQLNIIKFLKSKKKKNDFEGLTQSNLSMWIKRNIKKEVVQTSKFEIKEVKKEFKYEDKREEVKEVLEVQKVDKKSPFVLREKKEEVKESAIEAYNRMKNEAFQKIDANIKSS